jgi:L-threonylcarbamoyladenylate synthase
MERWTVHATLVDRHESSSARAVEAAAAVLRSGGVVAYPTETYYGLGAVADNAEALARIFRVKGRDPDKPLLLLVDSPAMALSLASARPSGFDDVVRAFWPGPLTLLLPARPDLAEAVRGSGGRVAVRMSSHPVALAVVAAVAAPITGTSANRSGAPPSSDPDEVERRLAAEIDGLVDAGPTPGGDPSTLVDLTVRPARIVRAGAVSSRELAATIDLRKDRPLL